MLLEAEGLVALVLHWQMSSAYSHSRGDLSGKV